MKILHSLAAIVLIASCTSQTHKDERSKSQEERISLLVDSIKPGTDRYLKTADSLIATVNDSTDYYELRLLQGQHYQLKAPHDSMLYFALPAKQYARRQPSSPRIKGLLASAMSVEAACYHIQRKENTKAIKLFRKAYDCIMQSDNIERAPDIAANLADAYTYTDNMPEASRWYRRALLLADSLHLPTDKTVSLNMGMARIYTQMGDYATAERCYKETERHFDELEPHMQGYYLNNYGNLYYYQGKYDEALKKFRQMKHLLRKKDNTFDMYLCKINMADVFLNLNECDSALAYLKETEPFFRQNNIDACIYYANTIRIGIATKRKDYDEIKRILNNEHLTQTPEQTIRDIRSKYLQQYYTDTGDYQRALQTITTRQRENDSLEYNKMNMRAEEIMIRLNEDTLLMHHKLETEAHKANINSARIIVLLLLLLCVILASVIIVIIVINRKKKTEDEMSIFRLKLESMRQRITPHFILNILNTQLTDKEQHNTSIIQLSRLIRSNLDMTASTFVTLTEELDFVKKYIDMQNIRFDEPVQLTLDIDNTIDLDETRLPAMFIQILVENSFKHALKDKDGDKLLTVRVRNQKQHFAIDVIDNGKGFDICKQNSHITKYGLNIIRQTVATINEHNSKQAQISFQITNIKKQDNTVCGCKASLLIPFNLQLT